MISPIFHFFDRGGNKFFFIELIYIKRYLANDTENTIDIYFLFHPSCAGATKVAGFAIKGQFTLYNRTWSKSDSCQTNSDNFGSNLFRFWKQNKIFYENIRIGIFKSTKSGSFSAFRNWQVFIRSTFYAFKILVDIWMTKDAISYNWFFFC